MSGGLFEYKQYVLGDIADELKDVIKRVDKIPLDNYNCDSLKNYIENKKEFKKVVNKTIKILNNTKNTIDAIDYFISGDISEEEMYNRIKK